MIKAFSIVENPVKEILLEGKLKLKDEYFEKWSLQKRLPAEYCDIRTGDWSICLKDLSYDSAKLLPSFKEFLQISTNLVTGFNTDTYQRVEPFQPPLQRVTIVGDQKELINFDLLWLNVNLQTDLLILDFNFWPHRIFHERNPYLTDDWDLDIHATVLLRRIQ